MNRKLRTKINDFGKGLWSFKKLLKFSRTKETSNLMQLKNKKWLSIKTKVFYTETVLREDAGNQNEELKSKNKQISVFCSVNLGHEQDSDI